MKILFGIAVLSFAALVWAALAIVRHVRKNSALAAASASDADISDPLDARLSELARLPPTGRAPSAASESEQDFSYFNRDMTASTAATLPYTDQPINSAVADRP